MAGGGGARTLGPIKTWGGGGAGGGWEQGPLASIPNKAPTCLQSLFLLPMPQFPPLLVFCPCQFTLHYAQAINPLFTSLSPTSRTMLRPIRVPKPSSAPTWPAAAWATGPRSSWWTISPRSHWRWGGRAAKPHGKQGEFTLCCVGVQGGSAYAGGEEDSPPVPGGRRQAGWGGGASRFWRRGLSP